LRPLSEGFLLKDLIGRFFSHFRYRKDGTDGLLD